MSDTNVLWLNYRSNRSVENRNRLVEAYLNLVDYRAGEAMRRHTPLERDDLFSIGAIALMRAIENFDPSFSVRFGTYAHLVIKRAMNTEIKKQRKVSALTYPEQVIDCREPQPTDSKTWGQLVSGLNPSDAEIVRRVYQDCETYAEIAREKCLTREAIRVRVCKIRRQIAANLAKRS